MIVNWLSSPTGAGLIVHWLANLLSTCRQAFIVVTRAIGAILLVAFAYRQWMASRDGHRTRCGGPGSCCAPSPCSPRALPWYFSWWLAMVAMAPWTRGGLAVFAFWSVWLIVVAYPSGEIALYNWAYLGVGAAAAPLAAVSLLRPDPLRLRGRREECTRCTRGVSSELDAAGISDHGCGPRTRCRALNASHGQTYFLATRLLTPAQRPAMHALYGFTRYARRWSTTSATAGRSRRGSQGSTGWPASWTARWPPGPRPPGARRARGHGPALRDHPRPGRRLHSVDADGHPRHGVRDVRRAGPSTCTVRPR